MANEDFVEELDDDLLGLINWHDLLDGLPESDDLLPPPHSDFSNSSPETMSSWIGDIENLLMKDDDDTVDDAAPSPQFCDDFMADILVDSPPDRSSSGGEVVDPSTDKDSVGSDDLKDKEQGTEPAQKVTGDGKDAKEDNCDDPLSKKLRRQLRNRDAAVRSRERRKIYVRDMEMKSKYLEAECRRLGRLLQCFAAENQALRLSLSQAGAFGVTSTKQESAVLLLESLLLGSLLWFLGIICLFPLPSIFPSALVEMEIPPENGEEKAPQNLVPRGAKSKVSVSVVTRRRCKASRTRMKPRSLFVPVLV